VSVSVTKSIENFRIPTLSRFSSSRFFAGLSGAKINKLKNFYSSLASANAAKLFENFRIPTLSRFSASRFFAGLSGAY